MERSIRCTRAPDDATEAHPEAHDRGAAAVGRDREHVEVRVVVEHHALVARRALEGLEAVARLGGGLVVLRAADGLVHLALQQRRAAGARRLRRIAPRTPTSSLVAVAGRSRPTHGPEHLPMS